MPNTPQKSIFDYKLGNFPRSTKWLKFYLILLIFWIVTGIITTLGNFTYGINAVTIFYTICNIIGLTLLISSLYYLKQLSYIGYYLNNILLIFIPIRIVLCAVVSYPLDQVFEQAFVGVVIFAAFCLPNIIYFYKRAALFDVHNSYPSKLKHDNTSQKNDSQVTHLVEMLEKQTGDSIPESNIYTTENESTIKNNELKLDETVIPPQIYQSERESNVPTKKTKYVKEFKIRVNVPMVATICAGTILIGTISFLVCQNISLHNQIAKQKNQIETLKTDTEQHFKYIYTYLLDARGFSNNQRLEIQGLRDGFPGDKQPQK
mgnify:CR=1 FL=1